MLLSDFYVCKSYVFFLSCFMLYSFWYFSGWRSRYKTGLVAHWFGLGLLPSVPRSGLLFAQPLIRLKARNMPHRLLRIGNLPSDLLNSAEAVRPPRFHGMIPKIVPMVTWKNACLFPFADVQKCGVLSLLLHRIKS